jgi:hypothetical protein
MTNNDFINPCESAAMCQAYMGTIQGLTGDGGLPPLQ